MSADNMIRTQVSLDKREYTLARKKAKSLGISLSEFIRRAIKQQLAPAVGSPWMRYAGMVESGDLRSSQTIDEIVYGTKN